MSEEVEKRRRGRPSEGVREAILEATLRLLDEQGLARLTTKEVARQAGVSEASIFYHFADKPGLVEAALEAGLEPLREFAFGLADRAGNGDLGKTLREVGLRWERFFDRVLPLVGAAVADAEIGVGFREYLRAEGYGAHVGVDLVTSYLESEQKLGRVRADVDPGAVALQLVGASFVRALQRAMLGPRAVARLPSQERTISSLLAMIASPPAGARAGGRRKADR